MRLLDTGAGSAGTESGASPGQRETTVLVRRAAVEVVGARAARCGGRARAMRAAREEPGTVASTRGGATKPTHGEEEQGSNDLREAYPCAG